MSFGNVPTVIELDQPIRTLIIGNNLDNGAEGHSKNGTGKSSIMQALYWGLYDEGLMPIRQDDFINITNKRRMLVTIEFEVNGATYILKRGRKPNILEITRNGEPYTAHSTKNINEAIVRLIGMDKDVFLNTTMLTNTTDKFMMLRPASQRDFIERILSMHLLTERATGIRAAGREYKTEIRLEEQKKEIVESSNKRIIDNINRLEERAKEWKTEQTEGVQKYKDELKELESFDYDKEMQAIQELTDLEDELKTIGAELDSHLITIEGCMEIHGKLIQEEEYLKEGKCPYCKQSFVNEGKLMDVQDKIAAIDENLIDLESKVEPLLKKEESVKDKLHDLSEKYGSLLSVEECREIMSRIKQLHERLNEVKDDKINPYIEQIEILRQDISEYDDSTLKELGKIEEHCNILVKLLTDSKSFIRKSIIDQYVPYLNSRINHYLDAFEAPHFMMLNNDLTVDIDYRGSSISYGNLSNGERIRINLSVSLAIRDLLSLSGHGTNLLCIDELFDSGLDSAGFFTVYRVLSDMKDTGIMIISHREELMTRVDQVFTVEKKGGFSELRVERT